MALPSRYPPTCARPASRKFWYCRRYLKAVLVRTVSVSPKPGDALEEPINENAFDRKSGSYAAISSYESASTRPKVSVPKVLLLTPTYICWVLHAPARLESAFADWLASVLTLLSAKDRGPLVSTPDKGLKANSAAPTSDQP